MKLSEIIGSNIRLLRIQKGIKQEVLAKHLGISKGRMSQIENGKCEGLTISRIEKIATYLKADFYSVVGNVTTHSPINTANNSVTINGAIYNLSPGLVKALANELANRITK